MSFCSPTRTGETNTETSTHTGSEHGLTHSALTLRPAIKTTAVPEIILFKAEPVDQPCNQKLPEPLRPDAVAAVATAGSLANTAVTNNVAKIKLTLLPRKLIDKPRKFWTARDRVDAKKWMKKAESRKRVCDFQAYEYQS
jgi:hypothetical protein